MSRYSGFLKISLVLLVSLCYLIFLAPWNKGVVTVTGTSKTDVAPQIANFSATVDVSDDDKDIAVNSVNSKMTELVNSLKTFGIADTDIQTSQVNVYENKGQPEILIYPPRPTADVKNWQASNSINIKLRDVNKASALTDLLNKSGATGVSGPNFMVDDTKESDAKLLVDAISDAKSKASEMAKAGGRRLGRMVTVSEGYNSIPYAMPLSLEKATMARDVSTPIEPGSETLTKTVTVVFELW